MSKMEEEGKNPMGGYGTFQGYHPIQSQPSVGFPQPVPPPSVVGFTAAYPSPPTGYGFSPSANPSPYAAPVYYAHGYQSIPVYGAVAEGRPLNLRMERLPCCGMGIGWFLFIIGFFFAAIPWYVGAFVLLFTRIDYREKPGFIACTIAAVLTAIAVTFGLTNGDDAWSLGYF